MRSSSSGHPYILSTARRFRARSSEASLTSLVHKSGGTVNRGWAAFGLSHCSLLTVGIASHMISPFKIVETLLVFYGYLKILGWCSDKFPFTQIDIASC